LHFVDFTDAGVAYHVFDAPVKASGDGLPVVSSGVFPCRTPLGIGDNELARVIF
jgi:hypothetical protein